MLTSTKGIVHAAEGSIVLSIEPPPRTLAEAMASPDEELGFNDILLETGINTGPVEVQIEVLFAEPEEDTSSDWEDAWEDFDFSLPPGDAYLYGPTLGDMLNIGTIEQLTVCRFRIKANGRNRMRDLVATDVVESYLVQVWIVEQQTEQGVL